MTAADTPGTHSFRKIVVATDFSEAAAAGVGWAVEIARAHGAHLTLVHAIDLAPPRPDYLPAEGGYGARLQEAARERLEAAAAGIDASGIEQVHTRLLAGQPVESILEVVDEIQAELVVLGTRGLSGLKHLLLGSTAARVVQHARCPVLTAHGGHGAPRQISTILVPTDFDGNAMLAAEAARDLLRPRLGEGARLVLLHAYHLPVEYTAYGTVPISPAFLEEARMRAQADLEEQAARVRSEGLEVETVAVAGYPVESILAAAEGQGADLIAMGTAGRTGAAHLFLGSTAERVVQRAPCPVLTLRKPEEE
jgi:nucleotide-binding universal stress UspA family protein